MKYALALFLALSIVPVSGAQSQPWTSQQLPMTRMAGLLRLVETIPVPTEGYMDRMAADVKGQRLFICGEAAKSLLVVDLRAGKVIHETKGLAEMPKKAFYLPDSNEIWLTLTNSSSRSHQRHDLRGDQDRRIVRVRRSKSGRRQCRL